MIQHNIYEAKTNLSKICKQLEDKKEDYIILSKNGKPIIKMTLINDNSRENLVGCAKGMFEVPDDFDDIDISNSFEEEIIPEWINTYYWYLFNHVNTNIMLA